MTTAHDLLEEAILSWRDDQRRRGKTTLPGLLARLATGELGDFPQARAHQLHPWSMFLTQLAAIALHRAQETDPRLTEDRWRARLLSLTGGEHEPWCLLVEDLAKPAFFQPPVPEGDIESWRVAERPDDVDILVTSKAHDVKTGVVAANDLEAWTYALTTLQTTQGYPGRGYNRISRMKGGYGSRVRVGLASNHSLGVRFLRDVAVMLDCRGALVDRGYSDNGAALVWIQPWDGATSLALGNLAPHFIEVCSRVRLRRTPTGTECAYTTSKSRRCLPDIENGDVGDPWIPIEGEKGALTVSRRGFEYPLLSRVVFGSDFEPAAAQVLRDADGDPVLLLASAMARGQGKTEGLHERVLVLSGLVRRQLGQPDQRLALGKRASSNVQQAVRMRTKVLFPALKCLALGETTVPDELQARVDEIFFERLFGDLGKPDDDARIGWDAAVRNLAWRELQRVIDRCCLADSRRYHAIADAEAMFYGCLNRQFPDLVAGRGARKEEQA
jgi:CRISPR system Cascade subunit CasA